jgi:hypothetical protein
VRGRTTLAVALVAAGAVPATAAAETTRYSVTEASGTVRVTFEADPLSCAQFGRCGDSGTVTYRFGGEPGKGGLALRENRRGRISGKARFRSSGRARAKVESIDGSTCRDTVRHRREKFSLRSTSRLSRLLFKFHPRRGTDYLRTDCAAPSERHLARAKALPQGTFRAGDFEDFSTSFVLSGESPFSDRGYRGTARWNLSYEVERRAG